MKKILLITFVLMFITSCFFENKKQEPVNIDEQNLETTDVEIKDTRSINVANNVLTGVIINERDSLKTIGTKTQSTKVSEVIKEDTITEESGNNIVGENIGNQAFGKSLQGFIDSLIENPDILKDIDCSKYEKEVEVYCKNKQTEYLKIIN